MSTPRVSSQDYTMLCNTLLCYYSTITLLYSTLLYCTILYYEAHTILYYTMYRRLAGPVAEVRYGVSVTPDYTSDSVTPLSLSLYDVLHLLYMQMKPDSTP